MADITPPKWEDKKHTTWHEKKFFNRMLKRKKGEKYRQVLKKRAIWDDGVGTNIDRCKLFDYIESILGADPYAENTD